MAVLGSFDFLISEIVLSIAFGVGNEFTWWMQNVDGTGSATRILGTWQENDSKVS